MSAAAQPTAPGRRTADRPRGTAPAVDAAPAVPARRSRTLTSLPFITLIAGVLAGGLLGLLLINNSLAAGSFDQARRKAEQVALFEQEQALRQEVQRMSSPTVLRGAARRLGMLPAATTAYLDIETGRILGKPMPAGGPSAAPDPAADPEASDQDPTTTGAGDVESPQPVGDAAASLSGGTAGAAADGTPPAESPAGPADGDDGAAVASPKPQTAYDRAIVSGGVG